MRFSPTEFLSLLILSTLSLCLLDQRESLSRPHPSHDLLHLEIDLILLSLTNLAAFERVDSDVHPLVEEVLVIDGLIDLTSEVGIIGVIVNGVGFALGGSVSKEGAGMRDNFVTILATADNEKLQVLT